VDDSFQNEFSQLFHRAGPVSCFRVVASILVHDRNANRATARLALVVVLSTIAGCDPTCPFGILRRMEFVSVNLGPRSVPCCGGSAYWDAALTSGTEFDIAFSTAAGPQPPLHAWLTTDCSRLFEGEYPPPAGPPPARCTTFIGPVAPGQVSARRPLPQGSYRLWIQAYTSSATPLDYHIDIGVWGEACQGRPTG